MADKHYIDEIGTDVILDCGTDITGATDTLIKVQKPDGTEEDWDAEIYNSNYLKHTTEEGDFDQSGTYKAQASLILSGWTGLGETDTFTIYRKFK